MTSFPFAIARAYNALGVQFHKWLHNMSGYFDQDAKSTTPTISPPATPHIQPLELPSTIPTGDENQQAPMTVADVYVCAHQPVMVGHKDSQLYRCTHPDCGLIIKGKWNAKNHCRAVHDSHPDMFLCALCGVVFKRKADLKRHEETSSAHFNRPRFWCGVCHRGYMRKAELTRHCREKNHKLINDHGPFNNDDDDRDGPRNDILDLDFTTVVHKQS
ncbi:hypothetical protein HK405_015865 [Cladochytrium tenue]|nr:hypothetical protein HK405_015865 [Cladochytrium tenue]